MSTAPTHGFPPHTHTRWLLPATLILLAGFALRIYRIDTQALSGDEAFSIINWTRSPLSYLFNTIALIDPQPPAALLSLYGWVRLAGDTELAARLLSALASTITLATTYSITRYLFNHRTALIALALGSINPFQIWYAQDVRSYSLWMCTSALSTWLMLLATHHPGQTTRWIAYAITAALSIYTFYLEGFMLIAQNLYILTRLHKQRSLIPRWLTSQLGIATLLAPWFLRPSLWHSGYLPTGGPANIPQVFEALVFGETLLAPLRTSILTVSTHTLTPASTIAITLVAAGLITCGLRHHREATLLLALYSFIPITLLTTLATITGHGYFRPRYIGAASIPMLIVIAALLSETTRFPRLRETSGIVLSTTLATLLLTISGTALWTYYFVQSKAPDWRGIMQTLAAQIGDNDLIIRNYPDPAFDYYYTLNADHVLLPVTASTPVQDTEQELANLLHHYDHFWFMPVPTPAYDGEQVVNRWLAANTQLISSQWIRETSLLQYAAWDVNETAISHPLAIPFSTVAILVGYRATPPQESWRAGTTIFLELFWEPATQTDQPLTVFTHVLGPPNASGSPLWAQDDHPPQHGRVTTRTWEPGTLLRDIYQLQLPVGMSPGEYTIAVGFYDPTTATRLTLDPTIQQAEPDGATLLTFTIQAPTE